MIRERVREAARRLWMKYALRGVRQNDAHGRLDLAYKIEDPWHMNAAREQFRFAETNRVIEANVGRRFGSLLEIGCGEGHQTEHLARLADKVTGIDVSANAVERARKRVPTASFLSGDLLTQPWVRERGRFELLTACEVLYYMSDVPSFLKTMDELGSTCVVTYFGPAARVCEKPVKAMPGVQTTSFKFEDTEWVAAWWPGAAKRS
jgi:2-polyprenyl-3-methyl-5-hydroxy-6-metoxy-1,4-benzoquinol methylase